MTGEFGLEAGSSVTVFPPVFVTQTLLFPSMAIPVGRLKEKFFPENVIPPEGVQEIGVFELPPPPHEARRREKGMTQVRCAFIHPFF